VREWTSIKKSKFFFSFGACGKEKLAYICTRFGRQTCNAYALEGAFQKGFAGKTGEKKSLKNIWKPQNKSFTLQPLSGNSS
jgi:hypothetical protein